MYDELDKLSERIEQAIRSLEPQFFEEELIRFNKMDENAIIELVRKDPEAMIPAFTRVCGPSVREFERLYGLNDVYSLRNRRRWLNPGADERKFAGVIAQLLEGTVMHVETFLYTFYKMWEEHQKRHVRGREAERDVREYFQQHGYPCEKITSPVEVNGAIPPSPNPSEVLLAMAIRTGVRRDLVKRAKEFSREFDIFKREFPNAKVIVVFRIPQHELSIKEEIRETIIEERKERETYDGVFFHDELENIRKKLEKWKIPKRITLVP